MKPLSSLCENSLVYNTFQSLLGAHKARIRLVDKYIRPSANDRLLDIGCGTGSILSYLPESIDYIGFDPLQSCIDYCHNANYGRGEFYCDSIESTTRHYDQSFDIVIATGVIHHLDDSAANQLFQFANSALKPGGKLVTIDPAYSEKQSPIAKWIISKDRGIYVRYPAEYRKLATGTFKTVEEDLVLKPLRIPYTHYIMMCFK